MKMRYRALENTFMTYDLIEYCGVNKRNAEKMIERWKKEGYIRMTSYGVYEKILLELM